MIVFDVLRPARADVTGNRHGAVVPARRDVGMDDVSARYRLYRKAFPWAALSCPAPALGQPRVAAMVRRHGYPVDVRSCEQLDQVLSAGIPARQIVMHDDGITAAPIRCAVNAGVGRLILSCHHQVGVLAGCAGQSPRVLVDTTSDCAADTIAAVLARPSLDVFGLHCRLPAEAPPSAVTAAVARMIGHLAHVRREGGRIPTGVSVAGGDQFGEASAALGTLAAALDDTFDDACARFHFPRPVLTLAPTWPTDQDCVSIHCCGVRSAYEVRERYAVGRTSEA